MDDGPGSFRIPQQRAELSATALAGDLPAPARVPASQARPPRATWHVLERRPLLRRLTRSVERVPLTLVCALAGSGKTVLAADWALRTGRQRPVAWATMTERDTQPGVFWAHLRLALSLAGVPVSGAGAAAVPDAAGVDALSVDLLRLAAPVVLVVDAADRIRGRLVFEQLARLMDNAGDRLRVLMTTRTEPPLPLHRYRVEGRVAEIRADELVLSRAEVDKVLAQHRLPTSGELTAEVLRRTEGWAAGVRLAALQLESDDGAPLDGFASDYLRAEVVDGLASEERDVLVRSSIVDELPPGLAGALTDRPDADEVIRRLSGRALVLPIGGRPHVFRVHPLLRELMSAELDRTSPGTANALHRRAAAWFRAEGPLEYAVSHAAAAGDWEQAARLVLDGPALGDVIVGTARGASLVEHLASMPERDSADLRLLRAAIALGGGDLEPARSQLAAAADGTVPDLLTAAVLRAEGAAQLRVGDLDAACSTLGGALVAADDGPLRLRCLAELSLAEACRGHLSRALRLVDAAEQKAAQQEVPEAERPAASELARAWVALERQDLAQAQRALDHGARPPHADAEAWATMTALLRARLMRDRDDLRSARRLLEQTERPTGWLADQLEAEAAAVGLEAPRTLPPRTPVTPAQRIHALLERADARCRAGRAGSAKVDVARALTLARSERLRRPFAHTSPRVRAVMRNDASLSTKARWLRPEQLGTARVPPTSPGPEPVHQSLSQRELEVLQHLSALLTTEEIAAEMFISVNTVRTHVRRILEKLAVSRRNEAVRRARELGLV